MIPRRGVLAVVTVVAMATMVVGVTGGPAGATTRTVTNCNDSGSGSLRAAVAAAAAGDTIMFGLSPACPVITLTTGEIVITKSLTITGPGAAALSVSGNHASRVFNVSAGTVVTISGLTIENASGAFLGGGIFNLGSLTVTGSTLSGNTAFLGGGIYNHGGSVTVTASTLSGNTASSGGGIFNDFGSVTVVTGSTLTNNTASSGSGIFNLGSVTVTASTLTGNTAGFGGGIFNNSGSSLTVTGSTLSGNTASSGGGGIFNNALVTVSGSTFTGNSNGAIVNTGSVSVGGSIFAGDVCGGTAITDAGFNLDSGHSCVTVAAHGSKIDTPAGLDPAGLANHGGPTQTIALVAGSAAIGLVPNPTAGLCPRVDQRGVGSGLGQACDAGAYQTVSQQSATIFAVTFAQCLFLDVGYNRFPNGTIVHWTVTSNGFGTVDSGQYSAIGGGNLGSKTYHFLSIPLTTALHPEPVQSHAHFTWTIGTTTTHYDVTRDPGC
jgi:hypothetical protein